jgi:hypothetical protein
LLLWRTKQNLDNHNDPLFLLFHNSSGCTV